MNLKINHRLGISNVKYFNSFNLNLKYDAIGSTFSFDFYFNPKDKEHAELACVSHFHEAIVEHNGHKLLTGFILSQNFKSTPKKELSKVTGYSKPGVLEDCEIPPSMYPLQTDGLTLKQIVEKIIKPFRLKLVIDDVAKKDAASGVKAKADKKIEKSTAKTSQNIKSYLSELTAQRNIVLTHNEHGDVVMTEAKTNQEPLFDINGGNIPGTTVDLTFNGQPIHSHIWVIKQASAEGGNAGEYMIRNPYCPVAYVFRPKVIEQTSGDDVTIQEAAMQALANELKNITLTITTDRWEIDGKPITPNNIVTVKCPEVFLYKKTRWFIEEVQLQGDEKKTIATIKCVLPEVYNKQMPKNIFVDPHENLPRF